MQVYKSAAEGFELRLVPSMGKESEHAGSASESVRRGFAQAKSKPRQPQVLRYLVPPSQPTAHTAAGEK